MPRRDVAVKFTVAPPRAGIVNWNVAGWGTSAVGAATVPAVGTAARVAGTTVAPSTRLRASGPSGTVAPGASGPPVAPRAGMTSTQSPRRQIPRARPAVAATRW
jgi:hypothetical protein